MAAETFAVAKIQPPRPRADVIARPLLEAGLAGALASHRLTLIAAPAGYGKTMALARAVAALPADCARAWVTIDEDDDAPRLFACLVAALEPYDLPWRIAPDALVAAASSDAWRDAVGALANALAAAEVTRGLIAFDDVHRLQSDGGLGLLDQLVEWLPQKWSVALASRDEPKLALARWRARGELAEFRAGDLRFGAQEIAALIGVEADAEPVRRLLAYTDGWAAAVRLTLSAGERDSARGADAQATRRHLHDFLATEVFEALPPELRDFLLRTSVLPELTIASAAAVSGDGRSAHWLDEIERRGLAAAVLDADTRTVRLHDLFREFLQERLRRDLPQERAELLQRAAATESDPVRQVGWLLRAGAVDPAQQALLRAAPTMLAAGADGPLLRLIEQFPPPLRDGSPALAFVRGLAAWPRFEWMTMQRAMRQAAEGFGRAGLAPLARQAAVFEVVALTTIGRLDEASSRLAEVRQQTLERDSAALAELMAYWESGARGPAGAPSNHLHRMTDLLVGQSPAVWMRCVPHFMFLGRPGVHAALQQWTDLALAVAGESHALLRACASVVAAWLLLWQGRLPESCALVDGVENDLRWLGRPRGLQLLLLGYHGACRLLRGERESMNAAFDELIEDVNRDPERRATWRGMYLFLAAQGAAAQGDWPRAQALAASLASTPANREWPFMQPARRSLAGRLSLQAGRCEEAATELAAAASALDEVDILGFSSVARVALAQALLRLGRSDHAAQAVRPALGRARATAEPAPLLLAGAEALDEVARADLQGIIEPPLAAWLRGLADAARERVGAPPRGRCTEPAPLSRREIEVLARLAAGDSNKLIARAFDLSPHTVKRHVANILDKLALSTRGQAAAWYRDNAPRLSL